MPKRRNKYEIYAELLDTVARKNHCRLTRASYSANLPVDRAKAMLSFLALRGFIKESSVAGSTEYIITKRGLEYLDTFRNMRKLFAALDEKHGPPVTKAAEESQRVSKIKANLLPVEGDVQVNEEVKLNLEVANVGETNVILKGVERIVPRDFEVTVKPGNFNLSNDSLITEGFALNPGTTEEISLRLRPRNEGTFLIEPKVTYLDESGEESSFELVPMTLKVVEADLPYRLATGYKDLDNLLLGGIPEKYAVILTSPPCDERDLLIMNFIQEGIRRGETTIYLAIDANILKTLSNRADQDFYTFICNPQASIIAENRSDVFKLKGVENLTDISIALTSTFRRLNKKPEKLRRACIGILSDILLEHGAVRTRKWLTGLLSELKSEGFTSFVLLNPQMHSAEEVQAVMDPFEGEIEVYSKQTEDGSQRLLRIRRMFNQRYLENEMLLKKEKLRV